MESGIEVAEKGFFPKVREMEFDGEVVAVVDSDDLHRALGVGREPNPWIRGRIKNRGLVEGADYWVDAQTGVNSGVGRPTVRYLLSVRTAKHLALMENTPTAEKVRDYLIDYEERGRAGLLSSVNAIGALLANPEMMLQALTTYATQAKQLQAENQRLESTLEEQKPKVEFADAVSESEGTFSLAEAAKILDGEEDPLGRQRLVDWLRRRGLFRPYVKGEGPEPYQKGIDAGYFIVVIRPPTATDRQSRTVTRVTPKGLAYIQRRRAKEAQDAEGEVQS